MDNIELPDNPKAVYWQVVAALKSIFLSPPGMTQGQRKKRKIEWRSWRLAWNLENDPEYREQVVPLIEQRKAGGIDRLAFRYCLEAILSERDSKYKKQRREHERDAGINGIVFAEWRHTRKAARQGDTSGCHNDTG